MMQVGALGWGWYKREVSASASLIPSNALVLSSVHASGAFFLASADRRLWSGCGLLAQPGIKR